MEIKKERFIMMTIEEKAEVKAKELGWELVDSKKLPHPDDNYLIHTIVRVHDGQGSYATHLFNEMQGDGGAFYYGHYDIKTLDGARKDLAKRK